MTALKRSATEPVEQQLARRCHDMSDLQFHQVVAFMEAQTGYEWAPDPHQALELKELLTDDSGSTDG